MKIHTKYDLLEAEDAGEGVCLDCGEIQEFLETRLRLGLCHECGEQRVMPAEDVLRVIGLVDLDEGD